MEQVDMKQILLTKGQFALVDDADYDELAQFKWYVLERPNGLLHAARKKKFHTYRFTVYMHQDIMGEPPKGKLIDHKDRDGLNNQRYNLRFATPAENTQNSDWVQEAKIIEKHGNRYRVRVMRERSRSYASFTSYADAVEYLREIQ